MSVIVRDHLPLTLSIAKALSPFINMFLPSVSSSLAISLRFLKSEEHRRARRFLQVILVLVLMAFLMSQPVFFSVDICGVNHSVPQCGVVYASFAYVAVLCHRIMCKLSRPKIKRTTRKCLHRQLHLKALAPIH